jgi:hypothetical protein
MNSGLGVLLPERWELNIELNDSGTYWRGRENSRASYSTALSAAANTRVSWSARQGFWVT